MSQDVPRSRHDPRTSSSSRTSAASSLDLRRRPTSGLSFNVRQRASRFKVRRSTLDPRRPPSTSSPDPSPGPPGIARDPGTSRPRVGPVPVLELDPFPSCVGPSSSTPRLCAGRLYIGSRHRWTRPLFNVLPAVASANNNVRGSDFNVHRRLRDQGHVPHELLCQQRRGWPTLFSVEAKRPFCEVRGRSIFNCESRQCRSSIFLFSL